MAGAALPKASQAKGRITPQRPLGASGGTGSLMTVSSVCEAGASFCGSTVMLNGGVRALWPRPSVALTTTETLPVQLAAMALAVR